MTKYTIISMTFGLIIGVNIREAVRLNITATLSAALALIGALLLTFRDFF